MNKTEKIFLSWVLIAILYFVSPSGSDMTAYQWIQYVVAMVSILGFVLTSGRE